MSPTANTKKTTPVLTLAAVSDIHLAFDGDALYPLPVPDEADLVLLAGDVADGCKPRYLDWILAATEGKPVAFTLGNHECYSTSRDEAARECRAAFAGSHVHFLLNESLVMNGIRIVGTDLWTDFQIDGRGPEAMRDAAAKLNDYRRIKVNIRDRDACRLLRPIDTLAWHQEARCFIEQTLNDSDEPVVLMTHHGVSRACISPGFAGDVLNGAFTSNLEPLFEQTKQPPILCVYGHTHQHLCKWLDCGAVLYSNQRGYVGFERVKGYDPERLIRIFANGRVQVDGYPAI
ncbi:MAG: metallophosphoesterase [Motiliproteus sp.]